MGNVDIIRKTKLNYAFNNSCIICFDNKGWQITSYCVYGLTNNKILYELWDTIKNSEKDELNSWTDIMSLTCKMGIPGKVGHIDEKWLS